MDYASYSEAKPFAHAVTSLRFFAALGVVVHHATGLFVGHAGVTFFFVLSGFLLAGRYGGISSWKERQAFWSRRAWRIGPIHIATLLVAIPLLQTSWPAGLLNGALLQAWSPDPSVHFSLNAVTWSLSAEAFFYAVFPFLAGRISRPLLIIWGAVMVAATTCAAVSGMSSADAHFLFYINPAARLFEFAVGMALATVAWRPSWTLTLIVGASSLVLAQHLGAHPAMSLMLVPAAGLLVLSASSASGLSKILAHPWLVRAGEASFLFFMTAYLAQRAAAEVFGPGLGPSAASGCAALVFSLIAHRPIDRALDYAARLAIALKTAPEPTCPPVVHTQPGVAPAAAASFRMMSPAAQKPSAGTAEALFRPVTFRVRNSTAKPNIAAKLE